MRDLSRFYLDLYDDIGIVEKTAARINKLFTEVLDMHFSLVPPRHNGYAHWYGYWAPGKTTVIQEDVMGMCTPGIYRDVFQQFNADIVRHLGEYVLFHVHSTGYQHYRDVLRIPGIAGIEITIEENGPPLSTMIPVFREILETSRLILFVHHFFEDVKEVLAKIPHDGLYLLISDKFISSEEKFRDFIASAF